MSDDDSKLVKELGRRLAALANELSTDDAALTQKYGEEAKLVFDVLTERGLFALSLPPVVLREIERLIESSGEPKPSKTSVIKDILHNWHLEKEAERQANLNAR